MLVSRRPRILPVVLLLLGLLTEPTAAQETIDETGLYVGPAPTVDCGFGWTAATDGVHTVVGGRGRVFVYEADTGALSHELVAETPGGFDDVFLSVVVGGGHVACGSPQVGPDGRAWVFDAVSGAQIVSVDAPVPGLGNGTFGAGRFAGMPWPYRVSQSSRATTTSCPCLR